MQVKKTKSGKYSLTLSYIEREKVFSALINFLETESFNIVGVKFKTSEEVLRHVYYSILNELLICTNFHLNVNSEKKIQCTRGEAICIMWLLRGYSDMTLLEIKSQLHKQLQ